MADSVVVRNLRELTWSHPFAAALPDWSASTVEQRHVCAMSGRARTVVCVKRCAVLLSCVLLVASGCASGRNDAVHDGRQGEVRIVSDAAFGAFTPREMTVEVGATVSFVNDTGFPHNVIFTDDRVADSAVFSSGEMFDATFTVPGVFKYVCSLHPGMAGTVTVGSASKG